MGSFREYLLSDKSMTYAFTRYALCSKKVELHTIKQKEFNKYFIIKFDRSCRGHYPQDPQED